MAMANRRRLISVAVSAQWRSWTRTLAWRKLPLPEPLGHHEVGRKDAVMSFRVAHDPSAYARVG